MRDAAGERELVRNRGAWLLATHRRCAWVGSVDGFARTLQGPRWPDGVNRSQVYRWENGSSVAGLAALNAYEQVLGLGSGHLVAVLDTAYRWALGTVGGPTIRRPDLPDAGWRRRVLDLVERADSDERMTGADWDDLTALLSGDSRVCLRDRDLTMLAYRLVTELCRAEGLGWLRRQESLARMVGHPSVGRLFVGVCGELAADPTSAFAADILFALDGTRHADARTLVLRHLRDPVTDDTRVGALIVALQKLRLGHFRGAVTLQLASLVSELAGAPSHLKNPASHIAAELLRSTPAADIHVFRARLDRLTNSDPTATPVSAGRDAAIGASGPAAEFAQRLAAAASARLPIHTDSDPTLKELVCTAMSTTDETSRFIAMRFLTASPYRRPLAQLLSADLRSPRLTANPHLSTLAVRALATLGDSNDRSTLEHLARSPGVPRSVREAAIRGLGHTAGDSAPALWQLLIDQQRRAWIERQTHDCRTTGLDALVYALGMRRQSTLLVRFANDPSLPRAVRSAATWWRQVGPTAHACDA